MNEITYRRKPQPNYLLLLDHYIIFKRGKPKQKKWLVVKQFQLMEKINENYFALNAIIPMEDTIPYDWNLQSNINHYFTMNPNIAIKAHDIK